MSAFGSSGISVLELDPSRFGHQLQHCQKSIPDFWPFSQGSVCSYCFRLQLFCWKGISSLGHPRFHVHGMDGSIKSRDVYESIMYLVKWVQLRNWIWRALLLNPPLRSLLCWSYLLLIEKLETASWWKWISNLFGCPDVIVWGLGGAIHQDSSFWSPWVRRRKHIQTSFAFFRLMICYGSSSPYHSLSFPHHSSCSKGCHLSSFQICDLVAKHKYSSRHTSSWTGGVWTAVFSCLFLVLAFVTYKAWHNDEKDNVDLIVIPSQNRKPPK